MSPCHNVATSATTPSVSRTPATNSIGNDSPRTLLTGASPPCTGANSACSQLFNGSFRSVSLIADSGPHPGVGIAAPLNRKSGSGEGIFKAPCVVLDSGDIGSSGWIGPAQTIRNPKKTTQIRYNPTCLRAMTGHAPFRRVRGENAGTPPALYPTV
jgi:hypothetical protein